MKIRLQDWLTSQADCRPDEVAVVFRRRATSYEALERASNRLARCLKAAGCVPGDRVGLLLPKTADAIVAMFGALKADCIYVPLDVSSPGARIQRILQTCECRCLVADQSSAGFLTELSAQDDWSAGTGVVWMDRGVELPGDSRARFSRDEIQSFSDAHVASYSEPEHPAHILFTSGSTGAPKGVVITHSNVMSFIAWAIGYFGIGPDDRFSGHPPLHFDLSTFDVYGTIAAGAQIHLLPPEVSVLPHRLAAFIRESELTQWFSVPSALHHMAKFDVVRPNDFPTLRRVLWCGEKFPTPDLRYWMQRVPHAAFVNLYGPTEATIASSYYLVPRCPDSDQEEIPIGTACDGESLLVLDEELNPTAPGDIGDLYIGGAGLSPGYWRDPSKTEEVFRLDPRGSGRIYKTGDLARTGAGGLIYLIGRADTQIKSRGYRIELGEIEAALGAVAAVRDGAIVAIEDAPGEGPAICCAYVPAGASDGVPSSVKQELAKALPRYMLPVRWLVLENMPRNGNGKVDRPLLKRWFQQRTQPGPAVPAGGLPQDAAVV